jgi:hypothetical protein
MDKDIAEAQNRPVWQRYGKTRVSLVLIVLGAVMMVLTLYGAFSEQTTYACADKENNPPDVQKMCARLTKGQWWNK